jgi:hypothetical protein
MRAAAINHNARYIDRRGRVHVQIPIEASAARQWYGH